ncbi:EexN family lipoprotein [Salmonella enterica subsp. enterica]|nr:EexN family lipoprotein [Salmonella enterica]
MKKAFTAAIIIGGVIFISGCEEKYSKEWYVSHHEELIEKYTECLLDSTWDDKICQNARDAMKKERRLKKEDIEMGYQEASRKLKEKIAETPVPDFNNIGNNPK